MPEQFEMTKLSTKGQIVLPLRIRNSRAWSTGTEFTVEEMGDGILLRPVSASAALQPRHGGRLPPYKGKPKTLAQMRAAIATHVEARHKHGRS